MRFLSLVSIHAIPGYIFMCVINDFLFSTIHNRYIISYSSQNIIIISNSIKHFSMTKKRKCVKVYNKLDDSEKNAISDTKIFSLSVSILEKTKFRLNKLYHNSRQCLLFNSSSATILCTLHQSQYKN